MRIRSCSIKIELHVNVAVRMLAVQVGFIFIFTSVTQVAAVSLAEAEAVVEMLFVLADRFAVNFSSTSARVIIGAVVDQRRTLDLIWNHRVVVNCRIEVAAISIRGTSRIAVTLSTIQRCCGGPIRGVIGR